MSDRMMKLSIAIVAGRNLAIFYLSVQIFNLGLEIKTFLKGLFQNILTFIHRRTELKHPVRVLSIHPLIQTNSI